MIHVWMRKPNVDDLELVQTQTVWFLTRLDMAPVSPSLYAHMADGS